MGFKKQERFYLRTHRDGRWWYRSKREQDTRAPLLFGEEWSNGEPQAYTMTQLENERLRLARETPFTQYDLLPATGESLN